MRARVTVIAGVISLGALGCGPTEPPKVVTPVVEIAAAPTAAPDAPDAPPTAAEEPERHVARAPPTPKEDDRRKAHPDTGPAAAAPPTAQAASPPPNVTQIQQARQLFVEGVKHYQDGRYKEARDAFLAAYKIVPNAKVLFNASAAAFLAGDVQGACNLLRQWKRDANPTPDQLASVNPQLSQRCP